VDKNFIESLRKYQTVDNWFLDLNPLSKLNILFALGFSAMIVNDWRYGFSLCGFYCILAFVANRGGKFLKPFSVIVLIFGLFTLIIRQFSVAGETELFKLFGSLSITQEALINGLNTASYLLGFSGGIVLFFVTTQMRDLMYSLEKKGISHEVSYIVLASFQTIIDLRKNTFLIMESQKARGIETEGSVFNRIKAFFPILGPLVLGAISGTEEKTIAMDARAFSVKCKHTFLRELRPVPGYEKIMVVIVDLAFLGVIVYKIMQLIG
jgi:energy-coupling factor transporter transmembrane protein EcfT